MCARTAALGAISNVRVNLADIKDSTFAKNVAGAIEGMEEKVRRREQELLA
jgi:formiminotetrahydrofolate cyclodeaminase